MGIKQFQIYFDNPLATYYGGETVSGRLFVNLDTQKKIRGITLNLKGEADVKWTETRHVREGEGKFRALNEYFHGNEIYFENRYYLLGGSSNDETLLQAGDHAYPFSMVLPTVLPSSFEGQLGHVRYTVKATLERPWKFDHDVKMAFSVVSPLNLNAELNVEEPMQATKEKHYCCWCCRSGPMVLVARIPATGFVPGQDIPITVELDNTTSENITAVICELTKVATFHAMQGSKSKSRVDNEKVLIRNLGSVGPNSSNTWAEHFRVPSLPPSYLNGCKIIDITYSLDVRAEIAGPHKDLMVNFNIVLGTVPLLSTIKSSVKTESSTFIPPPATVHQVEETNITVLSTANSEKPKSKPLTPVEEEPAILPLTPVTEDMPAIPSQMSIKGKFTVIQLSSPKAEELTIVPTVPVMTEKLTDTPLPTTKVGESLPSSNVESAKPDEATAIPLPPTRTKESVLVSEPPLKMEEPLGQGGDAVSSSAETALLLFEECVLGPYNIQDEGDSEHTQGQLNFTPRYPTYQLDRQ